MVRFLFLQMILRKQRKDIVVNLISCMRVLKFVFVINDLIEQCIQNLGKIIL